MNSRKWRSVRVFISSTFKDMHGERDVLTRVVFPELQERCNKLRIRVTPVDLRWGVTEEMTSQAMELCLSEVNACRPFFIGMLSDRYGWVPDKYDVPDEPRFDWVRNLPFGLSITHAEILSGALMPEIASVSTPNKNQQQQQQKQYSAIYIRDPTFLSQIPSEHVLDFKAENETAKTKLDELKQQIRSSQKITSVFEYPCNWCGIVDAKPCVGGLEAFSSHVLEFLWTSICDYFKATEEISSATPHLSTDFDSLIAERTEHENFIEVHSRTFVGRRQLLDSLHKMTINGNPKLLSVLGEPGAGKSSVMATFARECASKVDNGMLLSVIPHFIGGTPGSTDIRKTLSRICKELYRLLKLNDLDVPGDYSELKALFSKLTSSDERGTNYPGKIVIILDALNQLDQSYNSHSLDWLPLETNHNIRIVVSALKGRCADVLQANSVETITVGPLNRTEQHEIVVKTLGEYRKQLDERSVNDQMGILLSKADASKPLYLTVACEELRVFGVFEQLTEYIKLLPQTVPELFQSVLRRLEGDIGMELVRNTLCLIRRSRGGLQEIELLVMLGYAGRMETPMDGPLKQNLAQSIWAKLYRSLRSYLSPLGEGGEGMLNFFHQQLAFAVDNRYFSGIQGTQLMDRSHKRMADYFAIQSDPQNNCTWRGDIRAISELPYHSLHSRVWEQVQKLMTDLAFIESKCALGMSFELVSDYLSLIGEEETELPLANEFLSDPKRALKVRDFASFVQSRVHVLAKKSFECFSLAANLPDSFAPSEKAVDRWIHGLEKRPWLDWSNKPQSKGSCLLTYFGHTLPCRSVHICPTDQSIGVSCAEDCLIKLFNTRTGEEKLSIRGHKAAVTCVRFSPDGTIIASSSADRTVRLWSKTTGSEIAKLTGHKACVTFITFSPTEPYICSSSSDKSLRVWSLTEHKELHVMKGHTGGVSCVAWSPYGTMIASASSDRTIKLWSAKLWSEEKTLIGHQKAVTSVKWSPTGKYLATTSDDRSLRLWSVTNRNCIWFNMDACDGTCDCEFTPDGRFLISTSHDNIIRVYSMDGHSLVRSLCGHTGTVFQAVPASGNTIIATCSFDRSVKLWDLSTPLGGESPGHSARILGVAYHPLGTLVASASRDKTLKVWKTDDGIQLLQLNGHTSNVFGCSFNPKGDRLLSAGRDGCWKLWDVRTGQCLQTGTDQSSGNGSGGIISCWSPDGTEFMTTSAGKLAILWDSKSMARICTLYGHRASVNSCDWSQNNVEKLITASEDGTVKIWDSRKHRKLGTLCKHSTCVNTCAFSPDGSKIISGADDNLIVEWSAVNSKILGIIEGHTAAITGLKYSKDGRWIVSASTDCSVVVWNAITKERITSHTCQSRLTSVDTCSVGSNIVIGDGSGGLYLFHPKGI